MKLVPLSSIEIRSRQRKTIEPNSLADLRDSILATGLLHAPVCYFDPQTQTWVLVAGERRVTAIQQLTKSQTPFTYNSEPIPLGSIPITSLGESVSSLSSFQAELDENLLREDLPWTDRVEALNTLHQLRKSTNPAQTFTDTAREIAGPNREITNPDHARSTVRNATIIAPHLSDPTISKARNANEALSLIFKREEEAALAALAKRNLIAIDANPEIEIRHADLSTLLPTLAPAQFDLILADPPYGIGVDAAGFRSRTVHHHNYSDTADVAQRLAADILREGFRLTKPRANLFMFCDIDLFPHLKILAANSGWVPFRRPLIWRKSETEGLFPWGSQGPRITTEFILYATKGQRGLVISPVDVFDIKRVSRSLRTHGAEKPVELYSRLIECSTIAGERILDPCCGSGASLIAARELKRRALGVEVDETYHNTALANVFGNQLLDDALANEQS